MRSLQERYINIPAVVGGTPVVSAKGAFTLAAGRQSLAALSTVNERPIYPGGVSRSHRGLEIQIIGTGNNDTTIDWKLWRGLLSRPTGVLPVTAELHLMGSFVSTLSTATLAAGDDLLRAGETAGNLRLADANVFTSAGVEQALGVAMGSSGPSTPSGLANVPCPVFVPDGGCADFWLIEFDLTGATGADAIIRQFGVQS